MPASGGRANRSWPRCGRMSSGRFFRPVAVRRPWGMSIAQPSTPAGVPESATLSVIVPVFNERATVEAAIEAILATDLPIAVHEVIVIDDGSTDGTHDVLSNRPWPSEVQVVRHPVNRGKGAAIRT